MDIYSQIVQACEQTGIPILSTDTAARLMAILHEYGNNEGFTHSKKFLTDKDYIQKRFGLLPMQTPEPIFNALLKEYVRELQEWQMVHGDDPKDTANPFQALAPDWVPKLLTERYNIKFIG